MGRSGSCERPPRCDPGRVLDGKVRDLLEQLPRLFLCVRIHLKGGARPSESRLTMLSPNAIVIIRDKLYFPYHPTGSTGAIQELRTLDSGALTMDNNSYFGAPSISEHKPTRTYLCTALSTSGQATRRQPTQFRGHDPICRSAAEGHKSGSCPRNARHDKNFRDSSTGQPRPSRHESALRVHRLTWLLRGRLASFQ